MRREERIKLLATGLSNTGVAVVAAALIAPAAGFLYGTLTISSVDWWLYAVAFFVVGIGLHLAAQLVLTMLPP